MRCGYCGEQFDALERLSDKPVSGLQQAPPEKNEEFPPGPLPVKPEVIQEAEVDVETDEFEPEFDIPEILLDEDIQPASMKAKVAWSLAIILLVVTGLVQAVWYNRDFLLEKYPDIKPWAQQICDRLDCELIRQYSTTSIKLLNRDVRLHPHYSDTLLVNATMANRAASIQPYPKVQFSLFDTSGQVIASRKFKPEEYLDNSIDIKKGMLSNQPVHFVLEVTGPMATAVSFEFRFL